MKKQQLQQILDNAKFTLNDVEFTHLNRLLAFSKNLRARLFIEELIEEKEIDFVCSNDNIIKEELKTLNSLQDLIIELIVNENEDENEKQFRKIIRE
jgi:hypothetical protein